MQLRRQNSLLLGIVWFGLLGLCGLGASGFGAVSSCAIIAVELGGPAPEVTRELLHPSLAWDFGFILFYSVLPGLVFMRGGPRRLRPFALGLVLLVAGGCDVIENVRLWQAEVLPTSDAAPFAVAKFGLLALFLLGMLGWGLQRWVASRSTRPSTSKAALPPAAPDA